MDEHPESQAVTMGSHPGVHPYVRYCRIAAVAFGLVAAYTLVVKVPRGGMAQDWLHTACGRQPVHLALALAGLLFIAVAGRR